MLPNFPEFKKLELSDREDIEKITLKHPPYSDFVFENMWSWNIQGKSNVSMLNGNLVAIFEDVLSSDLVCSFFGNNSVNDTISKLISYKEANPNSYSYIGLVPEISIYGIDLDQYFIELDLNSCDYIYGIDNMATYKGHKFYKKRKLYDTFLRKYDTVEMMEIDISNPDVRNQIIEVNRIWSEYKNSAGLDLTNYREQEALLKLFELDVDNLSTIGVLYNQRLIGYVISKKVQDNYAVGLFGKFDRTFHGLNEFIMSSCAQKLAKSNLTMYNAGEDLGMSGLRISKNSYGPVAVLRKYTINKS